jgi:hypothetical protein
MKGASILALGGKNSASNRGTGADHGEQTISLLSNKSCSCYRTKSLKNGRHVISPDLGILSVWKEARRGARALPVRYWRRISTEGTRLSENIGFDTSATLNFLRSWNSLAAICFACLSFRAFLYLNLNFLAKQPHSWICRLPQQLFGPSSTTTTVHNLITYCIL